MVGLALGLRWLLEPVLKDKLPYSFFYVSIILTAWIAGIWEAVLAVFLGFLAAEVFLIEPRWSLAVSGADGWLGAILYFFTGFAIVWFSKSEQAARLRELTTAVEARKRQEELEQELKGNEDRYRKIFESCPMAQAELDAATGDLLLANSKFCEITGYSSTELSHKSLAELLQDDKLKTDWAAIRQSLREHPCSFEKHSVPKDGTTRRIKLRLAPVQDSASNIQRVLALLEDIPDLKQP